MSDWACFRLKKKKKVLLSGDTIFENNFLFMYKMFQTFSWRIEKIKFLMTVVADICAISAKLNNDVKESSHCVLFYIELRKK